MQVLKKGSMVLLFKHLNEVLCGGRLDLQGQKFSLPTPGNNKMGGFGWGQASSPLQQLPDMDLSIPVCI